MSVRTADRAAKAGRRRRDPQATRTAILDAAQELFLAQGVADTPTSAVARQAGVTKSLIHHHFGSKEELWSAVKERRFSEYYQVQRALLEGSRGSLALLRESITSYFRFLQSDPAAARFMTWRCVEEDDPCLEQEVELFELGMRRIREAQEAGEVRRDLEPLFVVKMFLGLAMHWFQTKPMLPQIVGEDADLAALEERYLQDMARVYLNGVRPDPEDVTHGDG